MREKFIFLKNLLLEKKRFFLLSIFAILIVVIVFTVFFQRGKKPTFIDKGQLQIGDVEKEESIPEIYREKLPDGREVEYGTRSGPLMPERLKELQRIIKEEQKEINRSSINFLVFAASAADNLVVEDRAGGSNGQWIKDMFQNGDILWTEPDLRSLKKIVVVADRAEIGGALGVYDYVKIRDANGNLVDWKGIIWVWAYSSGGMTVAHEYGHHFTDYWAAFRTNGSWDNWPEDEAGDYYQLRPLPDGCHCSSFSCPYHLRVWEILAEDFRRTVSSFNNGHMFVGQPCQQGGTIPWPNQAGTSSYLRALPLGQGATPTPTPTPLLNLPTVTPVFSLLSPTPTFSTTHPSVTLPPCPTGVDPRTIKLGTPCRRLTD